MDFTISQHAKERYAERIMDKTHPTDIHIYISDNENKIITDINKMIEFGELIHSGKNEDNKLIDVYLKDLWIVLVDSKKSKVITLFRIDLGVGDDFDKEFIQRNLEKLTIAKEEYEKIVATIENDKSNYNQLILENEKIINEYRSVAKKLEAQNASYKDIISSLSTNKDVALKEVNNIVATLIGKKSF